MKKFTKTIAAIMLTMAIVCVAGCKKDNELNNGTYNGHDYIDLGLPSGTLWATCNVGADNPEDYGDYFAWGETQSKASYTESNYVYSHGGYNQLTKYCSQTDFGFNGFTDNLTTLESSDDAATVNWGEGWITPTNKQWVELLTKCSHSWTTINGVKGCLFTGRNGNTIFLPAASSRSDEDSATLATTVPTGRARSTRVSLNMRRASSLLSVLMTVICTMTLVEVQVGRFGRCALCNRINHFDCKTLMDNKLSC